MKKVFQTIVHKKKGNCLQAALASLFEEEISDIPSFTSVGVSPGFAKFMKYLKEKGYDNPTVFYAQPPTLTLKVLEVCDQEHFLAIVPSLTYKGVTHAVIIDKKMKVVHDPNPNQRALNLPIRDIVSIYLDSSHYRVLKNGEVVKASN